MNFNPDPSTATDPATLKVDKGRVTAVRDLDEDERRRKAEESGRPLTDFKPDPSTAADPATLKVDKGRVNIVRDLDEDERRRKAGESVRPPAIGEWVKKGGKEFRVGGEPLDKETPLFPATPFGAPNMPAETSLGRLQKGLTKTALDEEVRGEARNIEADFDPEESLPAVDRGYASKESTPQKQAEALEDRGYTAWVSNTGKVLTLQTGKDGKRKIVQLHPSNKGVSAGDVAGAAYPIAKAGQAAALGILTSGESLVTQGILQGLLSAGTDIGVRGGSRLLAGRPLDLPELSKEAAKTAAIEGGPVVAAGALAKGVRAVTNFRRNLGAGEKALAGAAERQGFELPVAMETGSPALASRVPEQQKKALAASVSDAQERALGFTPALSEAELAGKVRPVLAQAEKEGAEGVQRSLTDVAADIEAKVKSLATRGSAEADVDLLKDAGKYVKDVKKKAQGYREVDDAADAEGIVASEDPLINLQKNLRDERVSTGDLVAAKGRVEKFLASDLAKKEVPVVTPESPVPATPPEFLPPKSLEDAAGQRATLKKVLLGVDDTGLGDAGKASLDSIRRNISFLDDFIKSGGPEGVEAAKTQMVPNPKTLREVRWQRALLRKIIDSPDNAGLGEAEGVYARKLYAALGEQKADIVSKLPEDLRRKLMDLDTGYAAAAENLNKSGIRKLLPEVDDILHHAERGIGEVAAAEPLTAGSPIIASLASGDATQLAKLRAWKPILGPEKYDALRQQVLKHMQNVDPEAPLDAGKFLQRLNGMDKDVRAELFGAAEAEVLANTKLMARAQGVRLPQAELDAAMKGGTPGFGKRLQAAVDQEVAHQMEWEATMMQQARDGTLAPEKLDVDRFTTWVHNASSDKVGKVMKILGEKAPELVDPFRQRTLARILEDVTSREVEKSLGTRMISPEIKKYVKGDLRARYQAVLGTEGMQFLDDLDTLGEGMLRNATKARGGNVRAAAGDIAGTIFAGSPQSMARTIETIVSGGGTSGVLSKIGASFLPLKSAQKYAWVREYLRTGKLPDLVKTRAAIQTAVPASEAVDALEEGEKEEEKNRALKYLATPAVAAKGVLAKVTD